MSFFLFTYHLSTRHVLTLTCYTYIHAVLCTPCDMIPLHLHMWYFPRYDNDGKDEHDYVPFHYSPPTLRLYKQPPFITGEPMRLDYCTLQVRGRRYRSFIFVFYVSMEYVWCSIFFLITLFEDMVRRAAFVSPKSPGVMDVIKISVRFEELKLKGSSHPRQSIIVHSNAHVEILINR